MKLSLEWKLKLKDHQLILFRSDWLDADLAILAGEDLEKSGKTTQIIFTDESGTSWTLKEIKKLREEIVSEPHDIIIYFDGGFNKETNQAGLGAVIYYKQGKKKYRIRTNGLFDEMETNNEGEYAALYFALTIVEELGVRNMPCEIKGDSQGVLKQLEGEWPCYEDLLNRWLDRIENKLQSMGLQPTFMPISRKDNKEADKLATLALEGKKINGKMQII